MLELYSDSNNKVFDFKLDIEGTKREDLDVRMIATFEKHDRDYVFYGKHHKDNIFRVEIPALEEVDNDTFGELKLEVIAEELYFNTWKSPFQIKSKKSVKVNEMNSFEQKKDKAPKVSVNAVNESEVEEPKEKRAAASKEKIAEKIVELTQKIEEKEAKTAQRTKIKSLIQEIQEPIEEKKAEEKKEAVEKKPKEDMATKMANLRAKKTNAPKKEVKKEEEVEKEEEVKENKVLQNIQKPFNLKEMSKKNEKNVAPGEVISFNEFFK